VGCGTGALTQTILQLAYPKELTSLDSSEDYLSYAQQQINNRRVRWEVGNAQNLPLESATYDVVVSGLVLNFIPDLTAAVAEMSRVTRPGGMVAAYVWDYAGKMELMRYFWDAAVALSPAALELDEGQRFPVCQQGALQELFIQAGLTNVQVRNIDVPTHFRDFEDYWGPFLGGQGPAPGYAMSLEAEERATLREHIRSSLPFAPDGSIPLIARAWAVRGNRVEP
jgi:SAM-dependent methyltransferase